MDGKRIGKIADEFGVSVPTVNNYTKEFGKFLSDTAIKPTSKRFTESDIEILKRARTWLLNGYTYDEVREELERQEVLEGEILDNEDLPPPPDEDTDGTGQSETLEIQSIEFFEKFVERLTNEHQTALDAKDETIAELRTDKERMQRELAWLRLPWYRRWLTKPPE